MENEDKKALTALIDQGYRLIPLRSGENGKKPLHGGYASKTYSLDDLTGNVGMMIDEHHVDVDLDWHVPRDFLKWLPQTDCQVVRIDENNGLSTRHCIYRADLAEGVDFELPKVAGHELTGPHASMVLQLRTSSEGEAYHVMVSPSVHPNGHQIAWLGSDRPIPTKCDGSDLLVIAGKIAAATFLVHFYPCEGARDDFALALMGALVRAEWSDAEIEEFFCAVARNARDDERVRRFSTMLKNARDRLADGDKLRGLTSMSKLLAVPKQWIDEIAVWLGIRKRRDGNVIFDRGLTVDTSQQAWAALAVYEIEGSPAVYAYGEAFARIDRDRVYALDESTFAYELNRCATWLRPGEKGSNPVPSNASGAVVKDMLAARSSDVTVPRLKEVSNVPIFTRDGRLIIERGYDDEAQIFLAPNVDVDVPDEPSQDQIQEAVDLLLKPIADFPFEDASDRANALAMCIEPYIRDLVGITPMFYVNKPVAGTGATLLVHACLYPALGSPPPATNPPNHDDEMEKTLTSVLMEGGKVVFFDNATKLKGKALAKALTSDVHSSRILGYSRMVNIPVRVTWVTTGNNPNIDNEIYRRCVDIRMDAHEANPEDRPAESFEFPDLKEWLKEHRADLVRAALIIVRAWVNAGMKHGSKSKASFEQWARVLSGILENAGVEGFLETPKSRRPEDEAQEWMIEVAVAWLKCMHQRVPVTPDGGNIHAMELDWNEPRKAKEIADMLGYMGVDIGEGFKDAARAVADKLRQFKDRVITVETSEGEKRYSLRSKQSCNTTKWWLEAE